MFKQRNISRRLLMKKSLITALACSLIAGLLNGCSCGGKKEETKIETTQQKVDEMQKTASGLQYKVLEAGKPDAKKPETGKKVKVHYTGWLEEKGQPDDKGKKFDSSVDRGTPFEFTLGAKQVIPGWDEGVALMPVGSKYRLVIPAALAYGEKGFPGAIPGNATLIFDVELISAE